VLLVTCFGRLILCPSLTLERRGFTRYYFAWLAV
jgi:hypothetical protein